MADDWWLHHPTTAPLTARTISDAAAILNGCASCRRNLDQRPGPGCRLASEHTWTEVSRG